MTLHEQFANQVHAQWSDWMRHLFSKSSKNEHGEVVIPKELVERWERQMDTPYEKLSETEKESDRKLASVFLSFMKTENSRMVVTRTLRDRKG